MEVNNLNRNNPVNNLEQETNTTNTNTPHKDNVNSNYGKTGKKEMNRQKKRRNKQIEQYNMMYDNSVYDTNNK